MITNSPIIQLSMVILAGAILLLYIRPTIADIRATQDQVGVYQGELDRVNEVNDILSGHINSINVLPLSSIQSLERYLPTAIDEIAVMRDLQTLVAETDARLTALDFGKSSSQTEETSSETEVAKESVGETVTFSLSVETTYAGLKQLLKALEINNYRLTVTGLKVAPTEDDLLAVDVSLLAYALGAFTLQVQNTSVPTDTNLLIE